MDKKYSTLYRATRGGGGLARTSVVIYATASSAKYYHSILNSEPSKLLAESLTENIELH